MRKMINKNEKGITLIALVITIIVLLILAGVAISMLTGDNGILNQAAKAKEQTEEASIDEAIKLAAMEAIMNEHHKITNEDELKAILDKYLGKQENGGYGLTGSTINGWVVSVGGTDYKIDTDGTVSKVPDMAELVKKIKEEYESKKSTLATTSTINVNPYTENETSILAVQSSDNQLKEELTDYDPALLKLILLNGNLLCLYDENVMNEEKIKICEENGIYLLGDIDGDHKITWWDAGYALDAFKNEYDFDDRQEIVADINCSLVVNGSDVSSYSSIIYLRNEKLPINNMRNEFITARSAKIQEGIDIIEMNATTISEIQEYIPSYTGNEGLYKFKIQRGFLYWVYDKNISIAPYFISDSQIELLGDYGNDGRLDQEDIDDLTNLLNEGVELDVDDYMYNYRVLNLDGDDKIDEADLNLLKQLVSQ